MPASDYSIFLFVTIVTVSDYAILSPKLLCSGQETCQTTCLLADQSSQAVFNNVCDVIKMVELGTDFRK